MMTRFSHHPVRHFFARAFLVVHLHSAGGVFPVKQPTTATPAMRILAGALLVLGALLTIGSLFADQLNLTGGGVGLGWKQLIGVVVGLVLALLGGSWLIQPPTSRGIDRPLE
jgi:hypothetical protein